ncbi:oocyte zinc finger protein XlCOF6-like [Ranitomeya imitator]|uniref:oocyte zinc finger protein XlCOF6-like n=1 Tax=Ranitomeya imitator TaxID=111125 RepID=UPI0037E7E380
MDMNRDKMAERILHLTLEILFRLTEEDYTVVKKTSSDRCQDPVSEGCRRPLSPITGPPPHPLIHEDINDQKILELIYKMIELLTGEVPIRCQDVAVYFSMEEWDFVEGHRDLYKDVMMEIPQPLTSPDLSSKRTTPERCPRPLLTQDCNQEDSNAPQDHQVPIRCQDVAVYFYMEEWEYLEGHKDLYKNAIMEVPQPLTSPDLSSKRTTPERCPRPLLPQDCNQEDPNAPQDHQLDGEKGEDLTHINTTETSVSSDEQCKEKIPTDNYPDDCTRRSEGQLTSSIFISDDLEITQNTIEVNTITPDKPSSLHSKDLSSDSLILVPSSDSLPTTKENISHKISIKKRTAPKAKKPFSHSEYGTSSSIEKSFLKHHKIPTAAKRFSCSKCGRCFNQKSVFLMHQRMHTGEKQFSCSECGKCYIQKLNLVIHQRTHTGEKPFSCSQCGKYFNRKAHLDSHQRSQKEEKPLSCPECEKCFNQKSDLIMHQRIHTGEKPFLCIECGKCFKQKSYFVRHQKIHTGENLFSCPECGKCFNCKEHLDNHHRIHTGEKPFSCSECGKCFNQKSTLVNHQKTHTGKKPFSCSECGKRFNQKSYLVRHHKIHTGEKPFSCLQCGKCFNRKAHLDNHHRTHTGEKPFSCSLCGKCFNRKEHVDNHQRTHKGEKPFSCSKCGKCFNQKSDLNKHQRTHTREKPFSCSQCGKCFNRKAHLDNHQRTHTGVKSFSCS